MRAFDWSDPAVDSPHRFTRDIDRYLLRTNGMAGWYWRVPRLWLESGYRRQHFRVLAVDHLRDYCIVDLKRRPFRKRRK